MQADLAQAFMMEPETVRVKPVRWRTLTDTFFMKEYQLDFNGADSDHLEVFVRLTYTPNRCVIHVPRRHPIDGGGHYLKRELSYLTGGVTRSDGVTAAMTDLLKEAGYELVLELQNGNR